MANKKFDVARETKRQGQPDIRVWAFPADHGNGNGTAFVNVVVGGLHGEFQFALYMEDARSLLAALSDAINHADPRADLGLLEEAA